MNLGKGIEPEAEGPGGGYVWGNPNPRGWMSKTTDHPRVLDENFATSERVWVSQHEPDSEGSVSILKCLQSLIQAKEGLGYKISAPERGLCIISLNFSRMNFRICCLQAMEHRKLELELQPKTYSLAL